MHVHIVHLGTNKFTIYAPHNLAPSPTLAPCKGSSARAQGREQRVRSSNSSPSASPQT
uniref:Uncharacterized protein n=1 Tax=Rhizophora mucronata TaxID=61149 RepID=A0A2P2JH22_RHIMU